MNTLAIEAKRKNPPAEADPAAAGGQTDVDYQRMQSYYVCAQQQNPVLYVVRGWFVGKNRLAFDAMQRSAGLNLQLKTNDFYPLCSDSKVQFETTLKWYQLYFDKMNMFLRTRQRESLMNVPPQMMTEMLKKTKLAEQVFVDNLESELNITFPKAEEAHTLTTMEKYMVPAKPDSMVFFTGPHMVDSTPVRRLVCYVHSLSENTASDILRDFPTYTSQVERMLVPPNAQGKARSNLVDAFLKEHFGGEWGWTRQPGLLFDQASIDDAPKVAPRNPVLVERIRQSFINTSCYVATDVLANSEVGVSAHELETYILNCLATVIDMGLRKQEYLKKRLLMWIKETFPDGIDALLAHPVDPTTHEKSLKERLKLGDANLMTDEVKDYAMSTLLRSTRKPTSTSWEAFDGQKNFKWPVEVVPDGKKVIRDKRELKQLLKPVDDALMNMSVADGPLARLNGDMNNPKDMWQLAYNIGGLLPAQKLRRKLYLENKIAHPHIGHWVSPSKPWNPPLTNPVGNWQNVYMILTKGMFDSHYMPAHNKLRKALRPIIEQVWHASSRRPFEKVIFAPERFNIRELPEGGQELQWHIDQDAIAAACPAEAANEADFAKLSLFLKAKDKDTGEPKYIPLEYDNETGLAGINLKKSMDFEPIYLGHKIHAYASEAEYREWGPMPDGIEFPIGSETLREYFLEEYGPYIFYIPAQRAGQAEPVPRALFGRIGHPYRMVIHETLDGLWSNEYSNEERFPDVIQAAPFKLAAFYEEGIDLIEFADNSDVDERVFPELEELRSDEMLFNPVFWYELDKMDEPVESEGQEYQITKIQNVGLAYYAMPSKLLAIAVDKLRNAQSSAAGGFLQDA